ncbi:MAG: KamA family radical SAM protein [Alphaproteobacteria bacterium]|nr:KamA family radical SAM protein [Alphaproteobacteria bacterium]
MPTALFPRKISPLFAGLIDAGEPCDPIARQFEPSAQENVLAPDDLADPIGDLKHARSDCLIHRHPDRVLLVPTWSCPVHCRFCFRRDRVGGKGPSPELLDQAIAYIQAQEGIREVILTGGDPLMLPFKRLEALLKALAAIPHLQSLRIHSRVPLAAPQRITPALAHLLGRLEKPVYLVAHVNHASELTFEARLGLDRLRKAGVPLMSQSVLLKGVNDRVEVLKDLFSALLAAGVKPYYLHHPDQVPGTSHFRVGLEEGRALMAALRPRISGLALPSYILDRPGGLGKVLAEIP